MAAAPMALDREWVGVWPADRPLNVKNDFGGRDPPETVLVERVTAELPWTRDEWVEEGKPYRGSWPPPS